ncbi:MAG: IS1634 family transposase, partial [Burkholderiales bacterium]|nr:IS1634 family transposase [Burkholderiales bacterium]
MVWPLLERMDVAGIINRHLPADARAEFDHGMILSLLIAARLYNPVALVNVGRWASESGADILWNIPPEKITDDRLGKSLDAFFRQRHSILGSLALHVAHEFSIPLSELHYDPTHIWLHGAYEESEPRVDLRGDGPVRSDDDLAPAHITQGRPMSGASKDVQMIHAGLCTIVDELGALPIFGHTVAGNHNGHTAIDEQLALLKKHLRPNQLTMISDRGTFSAGHLLRLSDAGYQALVAAPWNEFRALFDEQWENLTWKKATYLSLEQQRRRRQGSLPLEHYELAVHSHQLTDRDSGRSIDCRVIFVFSTADQKVAAKSREKSVEKIRDGLAKIARSVTDGRRSTDPISVVRRVSKVFGKRQAAGYFTYEMIPLSKKEREQLPPPGRGCKRPTHRFEFTYNQKAAELDAEYDGYSVLVTTASKHQSADLLFSKYKQQSYSELANHEFKTPLAVHPVFLKSPRRVEALVFLMMIALTVYFLIQRIYRQHVPPKAPLKEQRTTTQTILRAFKRYTLIIYRTRLGR